MTDDEKLDEVEGLRARLAEAEGLLDSDQYAPGPRPEPTTDELRAEAERLAREVWGDGAGLSHSTNRRVVDASCRIVMDLGICDTLVDEPTTLRALVAALREIRRGK